MRKILPILIVALLLAGCDDHRLGEVLSTADSLLVEHGDSALRYLEAHEPLKTDGSRSQRMRFELLRAMAQNKAYVPFTSDSVMKEVVDYYDHHGTANEQLQAHYLLGCVYRDLGDAPRAIECFLDAAAKADTTARECDYRIMSSSYSQMADLFYHQNLLQEALDNIDLSIHYAYKANDTLSALNSEMQKIPAFYRQDMHDSVIAVCERTHKLSEHYGLEYLSARNSIMALPSFLHNRQFEKAAYYLSLYENLSGYFNHDGNIEKGREVYYYLKGLYYLNTNRLDSAEYFFRKELIEGKDINNQNGASRGLSLLYKEKNQPDSTAKYALYSYEMNDSAYSLLTTEVLAKMNSLYNYSVYQKKAIAEKERADRKSRILGLTLLAILLLIILIFVILHRWKKKKKAAYRLYTDTLDKLNIAQYELLRLRDHDDELNDLINKKEKEVEGLMKVISEYPKKTGHDKTDGETILQTSDIYLSLQKKAYKGELISEDEWLLLNRLIVEYLPEFHHIISINEHALNIKEYRTCLLLRLHIKSVSIAGILGVNPSYITKISRHISLQLFNNDFTAKELAVRLCEFC